MTKFVTMFIFQFILKQNIAEMIVVNRFG